MPLQKITLKPGVNRENTRYTNEGGYYESDKVRFRQGTPEKIGGWSRISSYSYNGVCRSLGCWSALDAQILIGVGTSSNFYVANGGMYYDITPCRNQSVVLTNPFTATNGSSVVNVNQPSHGGSTGSRVYFTASSGLGGNVTASILNLSTGYQITVVDANNYTITVGVTANASDTGHGGTVSVSPTWTVSYSLTNPFTATNGSSTILVSHSGHGAITGNYVAFYGATGLGGNVTSTILNQSFRITRVDANSYAITVPVIANSSDSGHGGVVTAFYEIPVGAQSSDTPTGWGAGTWGSTTAPASNSGWGNGYYYTASITLTSKGWGAGTWGSTTAAAGFGGWGNSFYYGPGGAVSSLRLWSQSNFGENLLFGIRGGGIYYWNYSSGLSGNHGSPLASYPYANQVPIYQNLLLVSDTSRFVIVFGTNDVYTTNPDPMLVRWSDQENWAEWEPLATNQAGSQRLSKGSGIMAAIQTRQEILVWSDIALYSMQFVGAPYVWGFQLLADNISVISTNAAAVASGVAFWMGIDKFYMYDGRVQTLMCDLRSYVFNDINTDQLAQCFACTNEAFNEVWWFYPSSGSTSVNKYVVYNYLEKVWYYGTMARTAWIDSKLNHNPVAATYNNNLVYQENGLDDNETGTAVPINAYIVSSEFDLVDGDRLAFVWRMLPDITFNGSTATNPSVTMTLEPMLNSGSGYNTPQSVAGSSSAAVTQTSRGTTVNIEEFTGQVYIRIRGRQMAMRIESNALGVQWQLGSPRIDFRHDGRR